LTSAPGVPFLDARPDDGRRTRKRTAVETRLEFLDATEFSKLHEVTAERWHRAFPPRPPARHLRTQVAGREQEGRIPTARRPSGRHGRGKRYRQWIRPGGSPTGAGPTPDGDSAQVCGSLPSTLHGGIVEWKDVRQGMTSRPRPARAPGGATGLRPRSQDTMAAGPNRRRNRSARYRLRSLACGRRVRNELAGRRFERRPAFLRAPAPFAASHAIPSPLVPCTGRSLRLPLRPLSHVHRS
jgi:hypothetical protein